MTNKEKTEKLYRAFLQAWDNYKKLEKNQSGTNGLRELIITPGLKEAYQKWQLAVKEYYDFAATIQNKSFNDPA
jgi:hypothetical protein